MHDRLAAEVVTDDTSEVRAESLVTRSVANNELVGVRLFGVTLNRHTILGHELLSLEQSSLSFMLIGVLSLVGQGKQLLDLLDDLIGVGVHSMCLLNLSCFLSTHTLYSFLLQL